MCYQTDCRIERKLKKAPCSKRNETAVMCDQLLLLFLGPLCCWRSLEGSSEFLVGGLGVWGGLGVLPGDLCAVFDNGGHTPER